MEHTKNSKKIWIKEHIPKKIFLNAIYINLNC